jgi:tripartite-type tricarboxylate transporter receptor subunit TctC
VSSVQGHVDAGVVRLLGMVGVQRSPLAPAVPTLRESGYRGVGDDPWYGILAPAATPSAVVETVGAALRAAVRDAEMRRRFTALGYTIFDESAAEFARAIAAEIADTRTPLTRGAR